MCVTLNEAITPADVLAVNYGSVQDRGGHAQRRSAWRNSGRIDAEFSPDVGELHRICETAIRHHRAEFDQTFIGKEEPRRA